jgi:uncharacterized protein (DUF885 family)
MRYYLFLIVVALGAPLAAANDDQLNQIIDAHWQWTLEQYPEKRSEYGDLSGERIWTDMSSAAFARRDQAHAQFIEQLETIEPATLTEDAQLNRSLLLRELRDQRESFAEGLHLMSMNMRDGPQHLHGVTEYLALEDEQDFDNWLARLEALPPLLEQYEALLTEGIARDRVQAQIVMARVPEQLQRVITQQPQDSPFYKPFANLPDSLNLEAQRLLQTRAKTVIAEIVTPAYQQFERFIVDTYLPATRVEPGIGALHGGRSAYSLLARQFTTTEYSPEAIHQIGLAEVARIRSEMQEVLDSLDYAGSLESFNEFLRNDPQFYYQTEAELLAAYQAIAKRLDPELVKLFGRLPRIPYGVRPIPEEIAPDTTTAYYMPPAADGTRPGWYYVNLYRPEVRPKFEMEVLSVHESVPGHHLQIALAQELGELPEFRREAGVTAFVEGWGLYSERLGYDMGLYQDPYSRYGQLTYDMWRAVRLVVDTGMHYFSWSRERAINYFMAQTPKTEADIVNEIDRYIGWPGQALAYKIGQLKMLELRQNAEQALGDDFDIRRFHDAMLGAGAIPLSDLERRMQDWLAQELVLAQHPVD